jgi:hypothetical protein
MGILSEIYRQCYNNIGDNIGLLHAIQDVCGRQNVLKFDHSDIITISTNILNKTKTSYFQCKFMEEITHVLLATYERNANIEQVIQMIRSQTIKQLHLHILDNNTNIKLNDELDAILSTTKNELQISVYRPGENTHCFGRITYIRKLIDEYLMEYIIIFDDDQLYGVNWIENMINDRQPLSTLSWYGKIFKTCDYWKSELTYCEIRHVQKPDINKFTYFGPGGCILDTNLFLYNELYNYKKYSEDIIAIDDIWLSFVFKKYLNITFHRNMIHPELIDEKNLANMTWATIKDKKKDLFIHLSEKYDWDVTASMHYIYTINCVFERVYILYISNYQHVADKLNQMNICATCIQITIDTLDDIEHKLKQSVGSVIVLYEDFEVDDFFHYKFDKNICTM